MPNIALTVEELRYLRNRLDRGPHISDAEKALQKTFDEEIASAVFNGRKDEIVAEIAKDYAVRLLDTANLHRRSLPVPLANLLVQIDSDTQTRIMALEKDGDPGYRAAEFPPYVPQREPTADPRYNPPMVEKPFSPPLRFTKDDEGEPVF